MGEWPTTRESKYSIETLKKKSKKSVLFLSPSSTLSSLRHVPTGPSRVLHGL